MAKTVLSITEQGQNLVLVGIYDVDDSTALGNQLDTVRTAEGLASDHVFSSSTDTVDVRDTLLNAMDSQSWFVDMFLIDKERISLLGSLPGQYLFQSRVEKKFFDGVASTGASTVVLLPNVPDLIKTDIKARLTSITFEEPTGSTPEGVLADFVAQATLGHVAQEMEWGQLWQSYCAQHEISNEIWPPGDGVTDERGWS